MSLKIVGTKDGSKTLLNSELGSTYHSRHGALTESQHVFIDKGLRKVLEGQVTDINILEMGFGIGLNALLTFNLCADQKFNTDYQALELFPVPEKVWCRYQLPDGLRSSRNRFDMLHKANWNEKRQLHDRFVLTKHQISLIDFKSSEKFNLVYFDAFEPDTQPELWTQDVFDMLFSMMTSNGILTTYCCKGYVRRNMIAAGFVVKKVPGPPGKREMIVAQRPL